MNLNPRSLKLGPILAQYLYRHKRLDLPGIGYFVIDAPQAPEMGKNIIPGISFQSNPAVREDPQLIKFISEESGKMKSLASADFHSYLQLALQFLNIGKPFLFEGIGNLVKKNSGGFAFAHGESIQENIREYSAREISATSYSEESFAKSDIGQKKTYWQKPLAVFLVLATIVIVVWGGYILYQNTKNRNKKTPGLRERIRQPVHTKKKDSAAQLPPTATYKYILEKAGEQRAMERYNRLREYQWNVNLETRDSLEYSIYMLLPVNSGDTSRIIDSLSALNGKRVFIEY